MEDSNSEKSCESKTFFTNLWQIKEKDHKKPNDGAINSKLTFKKYDKIKLKL